MVRSPLLLTILSLTAGLSVARKCQNITIPISISSRNGIFSVATPANDVDVTDFVLNNFRAGVNYTDNVLQGYKTIEANYNLAATYCTPESGHGKSLQVLTHGVGINRYYWDFSYNNYNYSYVDRALAQGYSTLIYDRLGIGESSRGDPIQELQASLEVSALHQLTKLLRQSKVPGIKTKFDKIFHVGHSFGSILTYGLTTKYPEDSDGIVLTGFTIDETFFAWFGYASNWVVANTNPALKQFPNGYVALGTAQAFQAVAFAPSNFDLALPAAANSIAQPIPIGEILTIGSPQEVSNPFKGPVLVVDGDRDLIFCGGNCSSSTPSAAELVRPKFTKVTDFEAVIIPQTGHLLNFEYSHPTAYSAIIDFLNRHV
ncbi:catalytic protein, partial [Metarhizium hybridum]